MRVNNISHDLYLAVNSHLDVDGTNGSPYRSSIVTYLLTRKSLSRCGNPINHANLPSQEVRPFAYLEKRGEFPSSSGVVPYTDPRISTLRQGRQRLYLWPGAEADGSVESKTPSKTEIKDERGRLEKVWTHLQLHWSYLFIVLFSQSRNTSAGTCQRMNGQISWLLENWKKYTR